MIDSRLIAASLHPVTEAHVSNRDCKKQDSQEQENKICHSTLRTRFGSSALCFMTAPLELDENRHCATILSVAEVRLPACNRRSGIPIVSALRSNSARTAKVGHVGVAVVKFPAEGNVLARHVVVGHRSIPGFVRVSGILREIRSSRSSRCPVDRRQQHQIAPRVIDPSSADGQAVTVVVEPPAVVKHVAEKTLLVRNDLPGRVLLIGGAVHSSAALATSIAS